jgi:hypothetical protein
MYPSVEQHMKRLFLETVDFSFSIQEKLLYAAGFYSNEDAVRIFLVLFRKS